MTSYPSSRRNSARYEPSWPVMPVMRARRFSGLRSRHGPSPRCGCGLDVFLPRSLSNQSERKADMRPPSLRWSSKRTTFRRCRLLSRLACLAGRAGLSRLSEGGGEVGREVLEHPGGVQALEAVVAAAEADEIASVDVHAQVGLGGK